MENVDYFFWLFGQALEGPLYAWPVTTALVFTLGAAVVWTFFLKRSPVTVQLLWLLSPCFLTVLIFLTGTIFKNPDVSAPKRLPWAAYFIDGTLLSNLPLAAILIFRFRKYKFLVAAVSAWITWISFWAMFVSTMSVTGDWL